MDKMMESVHESKEYDEIANALFTKVSTTIPDRTDVCSHYIEVEEALNEYLVRQDLYSILTEEQIISIRYAALSLVDFSTPTPTHYLKFNRNTMPYLLLDSILTENQRSMMTSADYVERTAALQTAAGWICWQDANTCLQTNRLEYMSTYAEDFKRIVSAVTGNGFNASYGLTDWLRDRNFRPFNMFEVMKNARCDKRLITHEQLAEIGIFATDDPKKSVQALKNAVFLFTKDPERYPKFYYGVHEVKEQSNTWYVYITTNPNKYRFTPVKFVKL